MVDAVFVLGACRIVHGEVKIQRCVFRKIYAGSGRFAFRAVILRAFALFIKFVRAHADLIGLARG